MTVYASKPEINVREKLKELDKPSGIAGEAMLRAETPQEQQALIGVGRKNLIINGGFDVWQRDTSFSLNTNSVTYTADRWAYYSPGGTGVVSKEEAVVDGKMRNTLKAVFSNVNNSHRTIRQRFENSKRFSDKTVTLSFWAKSNTAQGYNILWRTWYTGSTYDDYTSEAIQLGTSWKYYSVTFKFPDISSKSFNDDNQMELMLQNVEVKDHELHLSDVQLEFGKVATPFEQRSYGEELALCQRYYEKIVGSTPWFMAHGYGTEVYCNIPFNTSKRTGSGTLYYSNPSDAAAMVTMYGNVASSGGPDGVITGVAAANVTAHSMSFYFQMSASTYTPHGTSVMFRFDASHWIAYDAEL